MNDDYILIQKWMIDELGLSGKKLLIYALIHGFSKDGDHDFYGTLDYIGKWIDSERRNVCTLLKELVEDGFLSKREENVNGVKVVHYGVLKIRTGCSKNQNGGVLKIRTNNIIDNIKEEDNNKLLSPKKYEEIVDCWNKHNGRAWGMVTKLTEKRKKAIANVIKNNHITPEGLMRLFASFPYADKWLFNPSKDHKTWKPDFDWWTVNTNGWLTKALEGKVHYENPHSFEVIMKGSGVSGYHPQESPSLSWNEYSKSYMFIGFYDGTIYDGYDDDNRPDGATITLNNARGTIVWDSKTKQWVKK